MIHLKAFESIIIKKNKKILALLILMTSVFCVIKVQAIIFALGLNDGTIEVWDTNTWIKLKTLKGHSDKIAFVAFSPNGKLLVSSSENKIIIWNTNLWKKLKERIPHYFRNEAVAFSPNNKDLAYQSYKGITVRNVQIQKKHLFWRKRLFLKKYDATIKSLVFSPKISHILVAAQGKIIRIWNIKTKKELKNLKAHTESVNSIVFSPDGQHLVSGSDDKTVKIWNAKNWKLSKTLNPDREVYSLAFSPNGRVLVATAYWEGTLIIWNTDTWKEGLRYNELGAHIVKFTPNNKLLTYGVHDWLVHECEGFIKQVALWDISNIKSLKRLKSFDIEKEKIVNVIAVMPDSKKIKKAREQKLAKQDIIERREYVASKVAPKYEIKIKGKDPIKTHKVLLNK